MRRMRKAGSTDPAFFLCFASYGPTFYGRERDRRAMQFGSEAAIYFFPPIAAIAEKSCSPKPSRTASA